MMLYSRGRRHSVDLSFMTVHAVIHGCLLKFDRITAATFGNDYINGLIMHLQVNIEVAVSLAHAMCQQIILFPAKFPCHRDVVLPVDGGTTAWLQES